MLILHTSFRRSCHSFPSTRNGFNARAWVLLGALGGWYLPSPTRCVIGLMTLLNPRRWKLIFIKYSSKNTNFATEQSCAHPTFDPPMAALVPSEHSPATRQNDRVGHRKYIFTSFPSLRLNKKKRNGPIKKQTNRQKTWAPFHQGRHMGVE